MAVDLCPIIDGAVREVVRMPSRHLAYTQVNFDYIYDNPLKFYT